MKARRVSHIISEWAKSDAGLALHRYLTIGCVSLSGVLTLFIFRALQGRWRWVIEHHGHHVSQLSAELLPVPVAFILWLRLTERKDKLTLAFSPLACAISVAAFTVMQEIRNDLGPRRRLAAGAVAGLLYWRLWANACAACGRNGGKPASPWRLPRRRGIITG